MKLIHCKLHGCHKIIPENVYLSKWKALGYKIVGDTVNSVSSINLPKEKTLTDKIDYSELSFLELKKTAKEKGIKLERSMKQEDILKALTELGE